MNRVHLYICILCCLGLQMGLSQPKNNILKDVSMPAPNAAALGKYGDIPVSYFTGVPNIGIPIYTVQDGSVSLPISLSYHASGVKVGETASWVGLNWSLNAGGMITRTVMGIPDEIIKRGYLECASSLRPPLSRGDIIATRQADSISIGNLDSEPDMYTFNVGGYSGKFTFDGNRKIHFIPKADFKVEYSTQSYSNGLQEFTRFTLTAPDGTRYIFGTDPLAPGSALEYQTYDESNPWNKAPSTWYLVAIESHDGKSRIRLRYETEVYSYLSLASWANEGGPWEAGGISLGPYKKANTNYIDGRRLVAIYSPTATIKFVPKVDSRTDLDGSVGAKSLAKIEIRNGLDTNTCYNTFEFFTSYFVTSGGSSTAYRRLRLDSLREKSCDGTIVNPAYKFDYHPGEIPNRYSYAIDHWGFANGQSGNDNTYNVPANGVPPSSPPFVQATANRESSYTPMVAGTIQRIKYPTGGHTDFSFEANKVSNASYNVTYQTVQSTKYELPSCNLPPSSTTCCNANVTVYKTFTAQELGLTFPSELQTSVYMQLDLMNILNATENPGGFRYCAPNGGPISSNPVQVNLEIWRNSDNNLVFSKEFNISVTKASDTWPQAPTQVLASMLELNVQYRIVLRTLNGRASFRLYRNETITSGGGTSTDAEVGGLRIKEMRHHDGRSVANDVVKRYHYTQSFGSNQSSGILYYRPVYMGTVNVEGDTVFGFLGDPFSLFFSTSITPLGAFHGYHVGYTNVWEENLNGGGRTHYQFSQVYNLYSGGINPSYPIPPAEAQLAFGLEIASSHFNDAGTEQAKTETQYKNLEYTYLPGRIFKIYRKVIPPPPGSTETLYRYAKTTYQIRTAPVLVARKTEIVDGVSTTTELQYDPGDNHLAPTLVTMTNSDNKVTTTQNEYVFSLADGPLRQELVKRNLIAQPVKTNVLVNGLQTGGTRLDYALFNQGTGLPNLSPSTATGHHPYPYQFYNYEMTWDSFGTATPGTWELQATINKYDATTGKPGELTHNNWPYPERYWWHPVTKLIQSRQYNNFYWYYEYINGTRLVSRIRDVDDQYVDYFYDPLQRLAEAKARGTGIRTLYTYRYKGQAGATQNFVKTESIITQVDPTNSAIGTRSAFQYLDGLGRPLQTVAQAASPAGKDVISAVTYDVLGRVIKEFTPYESAVSTGAFVDVPTLAPTHPHALKTYEASPLSRTLSVTPPGWYASTSSYGSNTINDGVLTGTDAFSVYAVGTLRKTTLSDPDGKKVITFTDKLGRTVLSRVTNATGSETADTYTQYDDKNRVTKVIPPGASHFFTPDLWFLYRYDGGDRIIAKKVPDAARSFIRYNNRDLPVLSYLPKEGKWLGTQYDDYGRPTKVGFVPGLATTPPNPSSFSIAANDLLSETFYDGQSGGGITRTATAIDKGRVTTTRSRILGTSNFLTSTNFYDSYGRPQTIRQNNHLLATVTATTAAETITRTYDLADNLLTETRAHSIGTGTERTLRSRSTYDSQGRLKKNYFDPGTGSYQETAHLNYNHRNEITERNLGFFSSTSSYLQSLDYSYNAQGWLTGINQNPLGGNNNSLYFPPQLPNPGTPSTTADQNDLFCLELKYDNPLATFEIPAQPQKNGNISQLWWRVRGRSAEAWGLEYDYLNRLTQAKHVAVHDGGAKIMGQYSEKITYADARGNIAAIQRYGVIPGASYPSGMTDNLSFTMKPGSNQLQRVADAAPTEFAPRGFKPTAGAQNIDYTYDPVGNQTSDPHKGITITYNYLNLPSVILWSNGNKMEMSYDAMGTKLSKKVSVGATEQYTQHYLGGIEYNAVGATRKLEAIYFADGRVYNTNVTTASTTVALRYEYAIRDHLGNTRLMFADLDNLGTISSNEILQENHFYPFGMNMEGVWMNDAGSKDSKYLYNGKELNDDFGLGWSDYGARWYDASIARWNGVDDLADKFSPTAPYCYALNNPILIVDPDGMDNITYIHIVQGSNLSAREQNEMLTLVNQYFNHLGLKRIAKIIQGPIKPENFDKTDNLVVMGNSPGQVLKFMKENLSEMYGGDVDNLWESWGSQSIEVSGNNPEHSEDNPQGKEDVVGVTIGGSAIMADNMTKSTFGKKPVSKVEFLAFAAVHGTGHNAGSKHGPGPGEFGFMFDGYIIYNGYKNNNKLTSIRSYFSTKVYPEMLKKDNRRTGGEIGIIALMKKNIGGYNTPVDNYSVRNKK